ncbi:LCP family protein [Paenibacillus senegalensis]|uniref:LCP family protein n=1 Tax=Paenibacillus senegalensis TaxID=1465766 RepID=UPI000289F41F|nr:LCP family protein [Paenibacillus senegalensis]
MQKSKTVRACLLVAIIIMASGAAILYYVFEPTSYFQRKTHPVLAMPQSPLQSTVPGTQIVEPVHPAVAAVPSIRSKQRIDPPFPESPAASNAFHVLIMGMDARSSEYSRTDLIMVARIEPELKKITVLSIPRDTRVELEGVGYTKINHAYVAGQLKDGPEAGIQASIQAVSTFLKIPIHYHVQLDFQGFEQIIDELGGVQLELEEEVWLTQSIKGRPPLMLAKGKQTLSGELALDFVRERYSRPNGEFDRQQAQMEVIRSLSEKVTQAEYLVQLPGLITRVKEEMLVTNLENADLLSLAWLFKNLKGDQMEYIQLPGKNMRAVDPLMGKELDYWQPDESQLLELLQNNFH